MDWTTVLKKRNYALEVIARELYKLDLEIFPHPIYGIGNLVPYDKQLVRGDMNEKDLKEIVEESLYEIDRYYDKGRVEEKRYKELTDKYQKILTDIQTSKDVKNWDDGK